MKGKIFSPGKLLLTSEYVVLDGAQALALPTKWGQELFFDRLSEDQPIIIWEAYHQNELWLKAVINYNTWEILEANLPEHAAFVAQVLQNTHKLSDSRFRDSVGYHIRTNLQFPANYGLGSSSTLMNNIAQWAGVDAFRLNEMSLGGSGYDVAVAQAKAPILFTRRKDEYHYQRADFNPPFRDELLFIHLNQKMDSREGISHYRSKTLDNDLISVFSDLTKKILVCKDLKQFGELINSHEAYLSEILETPTIKENLFPDYGGFIKSLGAWGGDFILASKNGDYKNYFNQHNYYNIFDYKDIIV